VVGDQIGISGERLSRDEALGLVRRAVESLNTSTDDVARASDVRVRARELLGRDSETLAERHFGRILRDAHDSDMIDLRRRGDDFEVARAAEAAPVAEQLSLVEPPKPTPTPAPVSPRGMGPRGAGVRGRASFGTRAVTPPPDLLSIGVVDVAPEAAPPAPPTPAPSGVQPPPAEPAAEAEDTAPAAKRPARRGRTPARGTKAVRKSGSTAARAAEDDVAPPPAKKRRRSSGRKTAADDE
jgi:hypothetical protein